MKNRSENSAGRGQILSILQVNSRSIDQKSAKIWTGQADLQPISFKSDRLLEPALAAERVSCGKPARFHPLRHTAVELLSRRCYPIAP